ncbi:MAG: hypothetical protein ACHQT5_00960 [Candidatus Saccharimonadales bacterium]
MSFMSGFHRPLLTLSVLLVSLISFAGVAYAASANQTVSGNTDHTVFKTGDTINITGTVNGDIYCAGQTISIDATVNGDVLCAGQSVDINGTISGNVRVAGEYVNLNATVTNNATLLGQDITVARSAHIGQDITLSGQNVTLNGGVGRDVWTTTNLMTVNGTVGRNFTAAHVGTLTLASGAHIAGDLTYTSMQKLQKGSSARVAGTTTYHVSQVHHANFFGFLLLAKLYWFMAMLVLGVVLVTLFPRQFERWNPEWGKVFWWKVLIGFVASFVVPALIILLVLSLLGVPLALLILLLWIVAAFIATPLAGYFVGSLVVPRLHPVLMVLIGGAILGAVELIPFIGWIVGVVAYWFGTGALLKGIWGTYKSASGIKPVNEKG